MDTTVGDDYAAPCPHCHATMDVGKYTKMGQLDAGFVGRCNRCHFLFEVVKIELIPVVYYKKSMGDNPHETPEIV